MLGALCFWFSKGSASPSAATFNPKLTSNHQVLISRSDGQDLRRRKSWIWKIESVCVSHFNYHRLYCYDGIYFKWFHSNEIQRAKSTESREKKSAAEEIVDKFAKRLPVCSVPPWHDEEEMSAILKWHVFLCVCVCDLLWRRRRMDKGRKHSTEPQRRENWFGGNTVTCKHRKETKLYFLSKSCKQKNWVLNPVIWLEQVLIWSFIFHFSTRKGVMHFPPCSRGTRSDDAVEVNYVAQGHFSWPGRIVNKKPL